MRGKKNKKQNYQLKEIFMKFYYDNKVDVLSIRFNDRRYFESDEISEGVIFDYDKSGKIIAIELLDVSQKFPSDFKNKLKKKEVSFVFA